MQSPDLEGVAQPLTVEEAIANLSHEDTSLRYYAAWWLGKHRISEPDAIDALIAALDDEADRTEMGGYPLRRNAARALGKLGDPRAIPGLIHCLDCSDFYVREAAAQSLGMLKATAATDALVKLLEGGVAANGRVPGLPHLTQPCEAVIEALGDIGATSAIPQIQPFLDHPTERVQSSALRALYQLTGDESYGDRLIAGLANPDINLRRGILSDLGAIGYLKAADAIASAQAENSFKLIALKGLLEYQVIQNSTLSDDTIRLMSLIDNLL